MIEIRVNNGVIEYRTATERLTWGDWKQAPEVDATPGNEPKAAAEVLKVGETVYVRSGLTPEYWAAMAACAVGKGDGMQAAANWRRAYEKAVQNLRGKDRELTDAKSMLRKAEQTLLQRQKEIEDLQQRRITERTLLLRAAGELRNNPTHYPGVRNQLLHDIDKALEG